MAARSEEADPEEEEGMKFYRVASEEIAPYCMTLDEAKKVARSIAENSYHDIEVEAVEVSTDKANILRMLNTEGGTDVTLGIVYTAKAKLKRGKDDQ
jgi:hypothetical protein